MITTLVILMIAAVFVAVLLIGDFGKEAKRKEIERIELKRMQAIIDKKHSKMMLQNLKRSIYVGLMRNL